MTSEHLKILFAVHAYGSKTKAEQLLKDFPYLAVKVLDHTNYIIPYGANPDYYCLTSKGRQFINRIEAIAELIELQV